MLGSYASKGRPATVASLNDGFGPVQARGMLLSGDTWRTAGSKGSAAASEMGSGGNTRRADVSKSLPPRCAAARRRRRRNVSGSRARERRKGLSVAAGARASSSFPTAWSTAASSASAFSGSVARMDAR